MQGIQILEFVHGQFELKALYYRSSDNRVSISWKKF